MNKVFTTFAVFITLTTSAVADPVSDFFSNIFADNSSVSHIKTNVNRSRHQSNLLNENVNNSFRAVASFYGHGERLSRHTASGAVFNPHGYSAAHRTLPFGTHLRVCHNGCVTVVVNDRGPFVRGRSLDLSYGAARAIGMGSTSAISVQRLN